jgi:hypothetical protein
MADETLTPELEIAAARMDLQCASNILVHAAYSMRKYAGIPQAASVWHAYTILEQMAGRGDKFARRVLTEFGKSATGYEGARVALIELVGAEPVVSDDTIVLTGDAARAMREAMTHYAA